MARVLLVGEADDGLRRLESIFRSVRVSTEAVVGLETALERIRQEPPVMVVVDRPATVTALEPLRETLAAHAPATAFIVVIPKPSADLAVAAMKAGAFDCVSSPPERFDLLATAQKAARSRHRTLIDHKIERPRKRRLVPAVSALVATAFIAVAVAVRDGAPPERTSLGSVHLTGLQWAERELFVGDWLESTITVYRSNRGWRKNARALTRDRIYRLNDSKPILLCRTENALATVGFDLTLRTHHPSPDLPTLQSVKTPGPNPTGLAWDGDALWSIDAASGLLYRYSDDLNVLSTVKSVLPKPSGLTFDGEALWVFGGSPLEAVRLTFAGDFPMWEGPYRVRGGLPEGLKPSGIAAGFDRLWFVGGGDPVLVSIGFDEMKADGAAWPEGRAADAEDQKEIADGSA